MEFFLAERYWSGCGRIVTNVTQILMSGRLVEWSKRDCLIAEIFFNREEGDKLEEYVRNKDGNTFEKQLEFAFYAGTPIDSWFDIEKFLRVCEELEITPRICFYACPLIATSNI